MILKHILVKDILNIAYEIARWQMTLPHDFIIDKSTLVQAMTWCRRHGLN